MWADNEADLDLLGFDFLVDALVVALTEPRLLPLTVGVLGDWGSGKSSLMQLAADQLAAITRDPEVEVDENAPDSPYLTVHFSPWQYEDHQDVKVALMTAVLDALESRLPEAAAEIGRLRTFVRGLKRWMRRTGRVGATLAPTVVPMAVQGLAPDLDPQALAILTSVTGAAVAEAAPLLADQPAVTVDSDQQRPPLEDIKQFRKEFEDLVDRLPNGDAVVVFIDDLDRCLPETVVDTFEAIRLFLNTPKTAYVLALNQNVVESAIDSRYPEITKTDGAGLGRDYLEKMLQLKVVIPPLSAPEAETYVNLLFAELRLPEDQFQRVLAETTTNRAVNGLSVAFNLGVAAKVFGDDAPPQQLTDDLAWAADITPVLGSSLRGNPRQLKRFLNNLLLKHRSAARRKIDLKLPVLAKLMVLEDQFNSDFQKLFDWEMAADGRSLELGQAEAHARAVATQSEVPASPPDLGAPQERDRAGSKNQATESKAPVDPVLTDAIEWADKPHIRAWLRVEPALKDIDLRPYFTYSRDKLSFGISGSRLAPHLQQLLSSIQSDIEATRRSHYSSVAQLEPGERAQLVEALLERVQRQPGSVALTAAIELAEQSQDIVDAVAAGLRKLPLASVPTTAGSAAVRRLPQDHPAVIALLDYWQGGDNGTLKTLVTKARQADAKKKGATGGNVG